ncbi:hypothetical protein OIE68_04375 [Nocardia vinacea]|uniref:hypothetical protein n=1 Tax=Nocardia vinacea TaxID=96468 RepID=UPI002E0F7468|nr:hypothetical protein OIE68_04375 [Nocardia vinacea]
MIAGVVAMIGFPTVLAVLWSARGSGSGEQRGPGARSGRIAARSAGPGTSVEVDDSPPRLPARLTVEWADPGQVRRALDVEQALPAELQTGRIGRFEYRSRLLESTRDCDPAPDEQRHREVGPS